MWLERGTRWAIVLLVTLGATCIYARARFRRHHQAWREASFWRLRYQIEFEAERPGAVLDVVVPGPGNGYQVFRREVRAPRLVLNDQRDEDNTAHLRTRAEQRGEYHLSLVFDLRVPVGRPKQPTAPVAETLPAALKERYLASEHDIPVNRRIATETLLQLAEEQPERFAADPVKTIFAFCHEELKLFPKGDDDAEEVLRSGAGNLRGIVRTMITLCRTAKLPARPVSGFVLGASGAARPHLWVEVYRDGHWVPYDPVYGESVQLPWPYLRLGPDRTWPIGVYGDGEVHSAFFTEELPPPAEFVLGRSPWAILDLTRLPRPMQDVLAVILLIPLGALVTCLFRNVIGLETSGRFAPVLLALSFVFSDWRMGLAVFVAVLVVGLSTRSVMERLQLLMMPRLSLILTLVVWTVVFSISIFDYVRLTPTAEAVLLPMVILTMIVERFFLTSQEESPAVAVRQLLGTVVVACVCYFLLRWEVVGRWLVVYPETHLITMAALVLLGRYTGYRLFEWWRFRDLAR